MNFLFYFFYGLFRRSDDDSAFTAILATFILIGHYLIAAVQLLVYFEVLNAFPIFSDTYLYNKLYWYIPSAVFLGVVYLYFSEEKRKAILDRYDRQKDSYCFSSVMLILFLLALPIATLVWL